MGFSPLHVYVYAYVCVYIDIFRYISIYIYVYLYHCKRTVLNYKRVYYYKIPQFSIWLMKILSLKWARCKNSWGPLQYIIALIFFICDRKLHFKRLDLLTAAPVAR